MEKKDWKSSFADYERILGVLSVATGDNLEGVYQAFKARLIDELEVITNSGLGGLREHQTTD